MARSISSIFATAPVIFGLPLGQGSGQCCCGWQQFVRNQLEDGMFLRQYVELPPPFGVRGEEVVIKLTEEIVDFDRVLGCD